MTELAWDEVGEKVYETGISKGVLYIPDNAGVYNNGVAWNGLTNVSESPSGGEANKQYADNTVYLNLQSAEEFGATIEAFTYPDEFGVFDGSATISPGVTIGQQPRKSFGLSYQTLIGNDLEGIEHGYKIHLVYGCSAAPSEKTYATVNDSPEAATLSWELTTIPTAVTGHKPTAILIIDSRKVDPADLLVLEELLYGTPGDDPSLPLPDAVAAIFGAGLTLATPTMPAYNSGTKVVTVPTVTGVQYFIDGELQTAGAHTITSDKMIEARPAPGYRFPAIGDTDWFLDF